MTFKEKLLTSGSCILVFLAPLIFWGHGLFPHISSKTFFIYGAVEILFFVWLFVLSTDTSYRLSKKNLLWFLPGIGFITWLTIASIYAVDPLLSFWSTLGRGTGLLTWYHVLALGLVIASLVKKGGMPYVTSLFQWFVNGAFVLALSIWMGGDGFGWSSWKVLATDAGGGFTGNSTLAATYLLFALAMGVFLLTLRSVSRNRKIWIGIVMAVILFSPVFATIYGLFSGRGILGTARGSMLALGTGAVASAVAYMFFSAKKALKRTSIAIIFAGVLAFGFIWMQLVTPETSLNKQFATEARASRFIFWDAATKAMHKHPLLGYGPENFAILFQENFNPKILASENSFEGWSDRAHNIYYELGSTAGYPAVILYALFLGSIFYALYVIATRSKQLNRAQLSLFAGLFVAYIINNLFTFDSNISLMALFILLGVIYTFTENEMAQSKKTAKTTEYTGFIAIGLFLIFSACFVFLVYKPAHKSKRYAEVFASAVNTRASLYQTLLGGSSIGEQWDVGGISYEIYKKYAANPAAVKKDQKLLPYAVQDVSALLSYLEEISKTNTTDTRLYVTRGLLENTLTYLSNRPYDEKTQNKILAIYNHLLTLSPRNPNIYWSLAQAKIWGGDIKGAENAYREAIALDPTLKASHRLFINFAKIIGNTKLYQEALADAQKAIPGFSVDN